MTIRARWLDAFLEWTVVLSYTALGYRLRRRTWATERWDLTGRTCLVTGANAGLGFEAARQLAGLGARVVLVARDAARGRDARAAIASEFPCADVRLELADLGILADVRALAARLLAREARLDVLVHNAGVMRPQRETTPEGIERTFATNVLGAFLLTQLLRPLLARCARATGVPARVVLVSSGGMYTQRLDTGDLQTARKPYRPAAAYAQSKRAQVELCACWAERCAAGVATFNAMHPGWVDTPGLRRSMPRFYRLTRWGLRTPAQGADTVVWLAASPHAAGASGRFWFDRRVRPAHRSGNTLVSAEARARLWDECVRLSGLVEEELQWSLC